MFRLNSVIARGQRNISSTDTTQTVATQIARMVEKHVANIASGKASRKEEPCAAFSNLTRKGAATPRKTSLGHLPNCDYFTLSHLVQIGQYWQKDGGLPRALLKWIQKIKDLLLLAQVLVKTANAVISHCCFAEDGTELFESASRMRSILIFPRSTNQILHLRRCRWRRRC